MTTEIQLPEDYTPATDILKDRTILVTGAGSGIGRVAAKTFAAHGATVILLGRTVAKLEQVYDEIEADGGAQPAIYPLNLEGASPKDYEELGERLNETFGKLDGLLHNAAILGTLTPIELYDIELWHKVLHVNVNAPFMMTQACLPLLRKSADATLIFTSADVGRKGRAYWGAYGVANHGLEGMMEILADEEEHQQNLRINCIDPGPVRTRMRESAYPGENPQALARPEDVMKHYLYLMGPDSQGHSGVCLCCQNKTA
ncbi:YciK family oxidoreductase [Candidatus Venteria ishoeyi]|uniref:Putative oxidoreductase YciK n=1 Tax=Candidatus Venteria ishoeyi TaxID=1899563 RepID=A0A1H6FFL0_9GAMM|nr:YciK family oxidoreductase [Candidatus Venteria ishoeyi]MDM8544935.1 YciK family oxidoreductase [Candidatus Venteria ishoeyi]SEH07794.1 putative oxidoreductase YciK [Candidatus Venteria ishoeyi]